eukprot:4598176-Amphidinium_carterae.1
MEKAVEKMTHLSMTDPKIRGSRAMILEGDVEACQITSGSSQVVLVKPVEDHPMRVGVEGRRKTEGGCAGGGGGSGPPNPPGHGGHDDDNDENWRPCGWNRGHNYDRWDDNQRTLTFKPQTLDKHKRSVPKLNIRE